MEDMSMIEAARTLANMADSEFVSDSEFRVLSEQFFYTFGCHWTEVLE